MTHLAGKELANEKMPQEKNQSDNQSCLMNEFNCDLMSGLLHCIPKSQLCDGPLDCPNDIDEVGCPLIIKEFDVIGKSSFLGR